MLLVSPLCLACQMRVELFLHESGQIDRLMMTRVLLVPPLLSHDEWTANLLCERIK